MKRRLFKLAVFLLLGAIVNVAVAWGAALLVDFHGAETVVGGAKGRRGDWVIWHHNAGGAIRIRALAVSGNNIEEYEQYPMHPSLLPLWGPLAVQVRQQVREQVIDEPFVRVADAYGWPTYSLWCAFAWNTAQWPNVLTDPRLSAILITSPMGGNYALSQRALPLRPIWPGFAVNTIFYTAILWLITLGPFTARRMIRHKRGHCIKCGYDLRGDFSAGCPECGWRRDSPS
ncbi:MAG: hypothetical protein IIA64_11505 [Planctomycetes bacterium]|nr:hypothetical protein [Planctomycetota bacterium]